MSRMIPPFYDETRTSDGEKKLFKELAELSEDYVILHSLGLARHHDKVFGEIDFVIISREGILCLEVKGGEVFRKDGVWRFVDRCGKEHQKPESPYQQAFSAMSSLRGHLKSQFGPRDPLVNCQYACGVAFPDISFTQQDPEIVPEITYDFRTPSVEEYIKQVFAYWRNKLREKHGFSGGKLAATQINRAANYLRGDFGFVPSLGEIVKKTGEELLTLTKEQVDRLAIARENRRILLKGPAGTGKTLLSLEYARRKALEGKRVLYLCFNHNLCRHLEYSQENQDPELLENLTIRTFHTFILEELKKSSCKLPEREDSEFYQEILPEMFAEVAGEIGYERKFDTLVIDEGQDLLRFSYLVCLDLVLKGGLKDGNWHVCFDPNQNIYNQEGFAEGLDLLKEYHPTTLTLDTNCRNTRPVGEYNTLLTGIPPTKYLRVRGEEVNVEAYDDYADERQKIVKLIKNLLKAEVLPGDIVLLSRYRFENSCLGGENILEGICSFQNITDLDPHNLVEDSVKFCTIHSFKGLEAPVVVLMDVNRISDTRSRFLNYTAISRATSLLHIFYDRRVERELEEMIQSSRSLLDAAG